MKSLIPSVFAIGCMSLSLQATSPSLESFESATAKEGTTFLILLGKEEARLLTILANTVANFESLLHSKTLSAYEVSRKAGHCAREIQISTIFALREEANEARQYIANNYSKAREIVTRAETEEEIGEAIRVTAVNVTDEINKFYSNAEDNLESLANLGFNAMNDCAPHRKISNENYEVVLTILGNDEIKYLTILADILYSFESFLESNTLEAYKVSQEVGHCARKIHLSKLPVLTRMANEARGIFINNYSAAREILTEIEEDGEIEEAFHLVREEKTRSSKNYSKVKENLRTLVNLGTREAMRCGPEHA